MEGPVCGGCGEHNPPGTQFCLVCRAYVGWDADGRPAPTRTAPVDPPAAPTAPGQAGPSSEVAPVASTDVDAVTVPTTGESAVVAVEVTNTSSIVEFYTVDAPGVPPWLGVAAEQLRLNPGDRQRVGVRLGLTAGAQVHAQQLPLVLRVRPQTRGAYVDLPVLVTVPVLDRPVTLRAEPQLVRLRDRDRAELALTLTNPGNRPVRVRLAGTDPEAAAAFTFFPPTVDLAAFGSGSVAALVSAPRPEPGQELTRLLTLTAWQGDRRADAPVTVQHSTSVRVEDAPVTLEVQPSLLRLRDATGGTVRVVADNRAGRDWAQLTFDASDPEGVVRVVWRQPQLRVPPGSSAEAEAVLSAPLPEPGTELTRTVTVRATDAAGRRVSAGATLVQTSSAAAIELVGLALSPSVLRLSGGRGQLTATVDNRRGAQPVRVWLKGSDPEGAVRFGFVPPVVDVPAGRTAAATVQVSAARPGSGREVTRAFTVTAGDGQHEVAASGSLVQATADRRPLARALFTWLGVLAMIASGFAVWQDGDPGYELRPDDFGVHVLSGRLRDLVSAGAGLAVLGVLGLFGLTSRKGRLSRFCGMVGFLATAVVLVHALVRSEEPGAGLAVALAGCVACYIGGKLVPRP